MKLAFIGAGNMGSAMARNLLRAGHQVTVYNRTRAHAEPLRQDGAALADSPSDAARGVDAIVTMLAEDQAVEQAVEGFLGTLAPGAIHIGMSTIGVACSKRLAERHTGHGQVYLAAPVFGRPVAAAAAQALDCGRRSAGIDRALPVRCSTRWGAALRWSAQIHGWPMPSSSPAIS
jgi:3-hydroxyisobutyrate dehydrogenase-like beta-hydroxyacid dehydrogenase